MTPTEAPEPPVSLAAVRRRIDDCRAALASLHGVLWEASGGALAEVLGEIGELALLADAAEVAVVAEAVSRGEPAGGQCPMTSWGWVRLASRRYQCGTGISRVLDAAAAVRHPATRSGIGAAILEARVPVPAGAVALSEMARIHGRLVPDAVDAVWAGFIEVAATGSVRLVRQLREALLARHGHQGELDELQQRAQGHEHLSTPRVSGDGLAEYLLRLGPEAAAVLEAAVDPLSTPSPDGDGPDLRSRGNRRAAALMTLIGRAVGADSAPSAARGARVQLGLTMGLADLVDGRGRGETTTGGPHAGTLLGPEIVRRLSCDALITPIVLDPRGNPMVSGAVTRYFTRAQRALIAGRDIHCTFPGCTMPATWCDAHHLQHWVDRGRTEVNNAALLCQRHHTVVHARRLSGRVVVNASGRQRVDWDLTIGSYDRDQARRNERERHAHPATATFRRSTASSRPP